MITDNQIIELCAEKLNIKRKKILSWGTETWLEYWGQGGSQGPDRFNPLFSEAQMATLIIRCRVDLKHVLDEHGYWGTYASITDKYGTHSCLASCPMRAVATCVARQLLAEREKLVEIVANA